MKPIIVTLIDNTQDAVEKLIFTKSTRLNMSAGLVEEIKAMPEEEKLEQLDYMSRTIPSSWEFVNYTFLIENVTRAFTHQFVRTRVGSYAQQTMRVLEMEEFSYRIPPKIKDGDPIALKDYCDAMSNIQASYDALIDGGAAPEDARGVLPTNIHTNICAQFNLRTMAEMAKSRTGTRTQDEYRDVLNAMLDCIILVHPWAEVFLFPEGRNKFVNLEKLINYCKNNGDWDRDFLTDCQKDLDLLRKG